MLRPATTPDTLCALRAATQHGLIRRDQALADGMTDAQIKWRLRTGRWTQVLPRVYCINGSPQSELQRIMAVALWLKGPGAISHRTAGWLHRFEDIAKARLIDVSTTRKITSPPEGIRVHVVRMLNPDDVQLVHGIPVTKPGRTLTDLATLLPRRRLERALDDLLRRGVVALPRLEWMLRQPDVARRPGTTVLRELVDDRLPGPDKSGSPLEDDLLRILLQAGLPEPIRQFEVWEDGILIGRADLAYPGQRVLIEADSFRYHGETKVNWERDYERDGAAGEMGYRVLRFTRHQIRARPEAVVRRVKKALGIN